MDFAALDFNFPNIEAATAPVALLIILGIASAVAAIGLLGQDHMKLPKRITLFIVFAVIAVASGFGVNAINDNFKHEQAERKAHNETVGTENLMKKYNLQEVKWSSSDTSVRPITSKGDGNLLVKISSGESYIFKYHVDEKTSEPFLEDMPLLGGTAPTQAITAKSLLK